jgi:hypothetical protein
MNFENNEICQYLMPSFVNDVEKFERILNILSHTMLQFETSPLEFHRVKSIWLDL